MLLRKRIGLFLGRFRRIPAKFWAVLATVFGIADFLTWSILADLPPRKRWQFTLGMVVLSLVLAFVAALRSPTDEERVANARVLTRAAREMYTSKSYQEALRLLRMSIRMDPDSTMTIGLLGRTLVRLGYFSEALPYLSKAIEQTVVETNRRILRTNRAIAHIMLGKYGRALDDIEQNLTEKPNLKFSRRLKALIWLYLGRLDNALQEIDAVLKAHPNYLCGHATRAAIMYAMGDARSGMEEISICETALPEKGGDFYCLAFAYTFAGQYEKALDALRIAVERDPKYRARAMSDPLFADLRERPGFVEAIGKIEKEMEFAK